MSGDNIINGLYCCADPVKQKEREERVRMLREKQAEEQRKKMEELQEAQRRAEEIREKQLQERQRKILEQRRREDEHRALVEERRRRMELEENVMPVLSSYTYIHWFPHHLWIKIKT